MGISKMQLFVWKGIKNNIILWYEDILKMPFLGPVVSKMPFNGMGELKNAFL